MGVSIILSASLDEPDGGRFREFLSWNGVHISMAVGVYVSLPVIKAGLLELLSTSC